MSKPMDLYYLSGSPPCHAVLMTAKMLNINFNLIEVNLMTGDHLKPAFLKVNPQHTIPTLVDNGLTLWESRPIMTYMVEKYGRKDTLYPKEPAQRAKINQKLYFDFEIYGNVRAYYSDPLFHGKTKDKEMLKKAVHKIDSFEQSLGEQNYAAGDHLTLADIVLAVTISTTATFGHDFSGYPNINKWLETCKSEIAGYEEINQAGLDKLAQLITLKAGTNLY